MSSPRPRLGVFRPISRGALQASVALVIFVLLIEAANLLFTARLVAESNTRAQALCMFDAHLGTAPLTLNPATRKASLLGVQIVSDARVAFHRAGCEGRLPPPDPSFVKWARYYKLPTG